MAMPDSMPAYSLARIAADILLSVSERAEDLSNAATPEIKNFIVLCKSGRIIISIKA